MTLVEDSNGQSLASPRGRRIVFTPERFDQIRNLVERGHGREEIAEIVGCTVNSLQVTCSREGISLRRPREFGPAVKAVKRTPVIPIEPGPPREPHNAHPWSGEDKPKHKSPTFTLRIGYGDRTLDVPLTIDDCTFGELACVAAVKEVKLGDMISQAIVAGIREITS